MSINKLFLYQIYTHTHTVISNFLCIIVQFILILISNRRQETRIKVFEIKNQNQSNTQILLTF